MTVIYHLKNLKTPKLMFRGFFYTFLPNCYIIFMNIVFQINVLILNPV